MSRDLANSNYEGTGGKDKWEYTAPVGSFPANPFGLHDMNGNALEWCSSLYKPYPYKADDGREDLKDKGDRVLRGGCWLYDRAVVRCAYRYYFHPVFRYWIGGFRCAR